MPLLREQIIRQASGNRHQRLVDRFWLRPFKFSLKNYVNYVNRALTWMRMTPPPLGVGSASALVQLVALLLATTRVSWRNTRFSGAVSEYHFAGHHFELD